MVVIYLHGFRSSPASQKGKILKSAFEARETFLAPDLNRSPNEVKSVLIDLVSGISPDTICLIGSSLGGFYATWLAEKIGCKAVLLNPATHPWEVVRQHLGVQTIHGTDRTIEVKPEFEAEMLSMAAKPTNAHRYLVFLSTDDEVLDWHRAQRQYADCEQVILEGNNHQIEHFETCLARIEQFIKS